MVLVFCPLRSQGLPILLPNRPHLRCVQGKPQRPSQPYQRPNLSAYRDHVLTDLFVCLPISTEADAVRLGDWAPICHT